MFLLSDAVVVVMGVSRSYDDVVTLMNIMTEKLEVNNSFQLMINLKSIYDFLEQNYDRNVTLFLNSDQKYFIHFSQKRKLAIF